MSAAAPSTGPEEVRLMLRGEPQTWRINPGSIKEEAHKPQLPSGKHTKNYGKSPFLMGKSTINGHFQ